MVARPAAAPRLPRTAQVRFVAPDPRWRLVPAERLSWRLHRLQGTDPRRWRYDVPVYAAVLYRGVWPGVDLRYDQHAGVLKGTWTVAPDTDPNVIRWDYGPGARVSLTATGALRIAPAGGGDLLERAPVAWQTTPAGRRPVRVEYRLLGQGRVGFTLGRYDPSRSLVIDPELVCSRLLGGSWAVAAGLQDTAVARDGSLYTLSGVMRRGLDKLGRSYFTGYDVAVTALDRTGQRIRWRTVISTRGLAGGRLTTTPSGPVLGMLVTRGDLPVRRADQPRFGGGHSDGYLAGFSAHGRLRWATYLGGRGEDPCCYALLEQGGRLTVSGTTDSRDFPQRRPMRMPPGAWSAGPGTGFLAEYASDGRRLRSTFFGSPARGGAGAVTALAAGPYGDGTLYVGGLVAYCGIPARTVVVACPPGRSLPPPDLSAANPLVVGADTAPSVLTSPVMYVARLAPRWSAIHWVAYFGGTAPESSPYSTWLADIAVDRRGRVAVVGSTPIPDLAVTPGAAQPVYGGGPLDGWIAAVGSEGLGFLSYLGGTSTDQLERVAFDRAGRIVVTGGSASVNYPTRRAEQPFLAGLSDTVITRLDPAGNLLDSTYLGGQETESLDGGASRLHLSPDGDAIVYSWTSSPDFPLDEPHRPVGTDPVDGYVVRYRFDRPGTCPALPPTPDCVPLS